MLTRRGFLAATGAAFAQSPAPRPNVVLLLVDDMGYADAACFGATDIRTPHIDRLAREGVKLTDCYSNGPVCTPTRCGLMTGRYQQRYGLEWAFPAGHNSYGLEPHNSTIARDLKKEGYRTACFGKWHLGAKPEYGPNRHGFDEFYGLLSGNIDHYSHREVNGEEDWFEDLRPVKTAGYSTELIRDRALRFLDAHARSPFFLYLPFNAVHWPFQGPGRPDTVRTRATWFDGTREGEFQPMMESVDAAVGAVLAALQKHGVEKNTLVIFTSDNGGERLSNNRPFFHHKATLWEGGIRVPGIIKWPGKLPAGKVSRQACMSFDFTATIAAACGVRDPQPAFDGIDLVPSLAAGREVERTLHWRIHRGERQQWAVRKGNWKYLKDGGIELLYNLAADPSERKDLGFQHPEKIVTLRKEMQDWEAMLKKNPPPQVYA
jgi:arylsulfatase A